MQPSNSNFNSTVPPYAARQPVPPQNYGQPIPAAHPAPNAYYAHQIPSYITMHTAPQMRLPYMHQPQYAQYQGQQVQQYSYGPPQQMMVNATAAQVSRRPPFRPTQQGDAYPTGQYNNGNSMNAVETVSYAPCNNDVSQSQIPPNAYPPKQITNMPNIPAPTTHHQMAPQVVQHSMYFMPVDQSRFMHAGAVPPQHYPYPMNPDLLHHYLQQQQQQLYRSQMAAQPPSRPESVMYQEPNMNYQSHGYDNNMTYRSDSESHPGKESVPPKDPVNVRPQGSVATPQQHSSTTSIASIVSDIIQEKIQAKNKAFIEAEQKSQAATNQICQQSPEQEASQSPASMVVMEEAKEIADVTEESPQEYHGCTLCQARQLPESEYTSHCLRDAENRATCPILRAKVCPLCQATGDNAHDQFFCPTRNDERLERTKAMLNGQAELDAKFEQMALHNGETEIHVDDTASEHPTYEHDLHEQIDLEHEAASVAESYTSSIPVRPGSAAPTNSSIVGSPEPPSKQDYPTQKVWVNSAYQRKSHYHRGTRGGHGHGHGHHRNVENGNGTHTISQKPKEHNNNPGENYGSKRRRGW
ncbi:hypothetical protein QR680_000747 [Steinernema hermaphroditum]|uniref:Nanos-type domain-containing protein n=1 Tax=Steinernema hermaphroditum TaxID=289476 RepID=A0AA39LEM8_9BILA|nr:hypothetical protein QR680_000747 [Steinernema hermaphroditum]